MNKLRERQRYLAVRAIGCVIALGVIIIIAVTFAFLQTLMRGEPQWLWLALIMAGAAVLLYFRWFCYRPYRETEQLIHMFATRYIPQNIFNIRYDYSPAMAEALEKLKDSMDADKLLSANKRQAQYMALQNQINPHFLYNTLEGIRGEALTANVPSIARMTAALSTYFRYTISKVENLVTVEEELKNVETFFAIQQYRFGERIQMRIICDEEDKGTIMRCRLPKLTLQPIVENSIIHGLERKRGAGLLTIRLIQTARRLVIIVSDDGLGMPPDTLSELQAVLIRASYHEEEEARQGIAIANVNNRIRLLFGERYGMAIQSTPGLGTDVTVTLPIITADNQKVLLS